MARLIQTPTSGGLVGPFEPLVLRTLLEKLPDRYGVAPNFQLKQPATTTLSSSTSPSSRRTPSSSSRRRSGTGDSSETTPSGS